MSQAEFTEEQKETVNSKRKKVLFIHSIICNTYCNSGTVLDSKNNSSKQNRGILFRVKFTSTRASQVVLVVKNPPAKTGDITDAGLIPGSG